jgi:hypothetical protein
MRKISPWGRLLGAQHGEEAVAPAPAERRAWTCKACEMEMAFSLVDRSGSG